MTYDANRALISHDMYPKKQPPPVVYIGDGYGAAIAAGTEEATLEVAGATELFSAR